MITPLCTAPFYHLIFEGFFKEIGPFSRENNILPHYVTTIFKKVTLY
jgi:hypothetical protein